MVEFYSIPFPRFPLRKKEHNSYLGKNRTHDFPTSRCADNLLDHSGKRLTWYRSCVFTFIRTLRALRHKPVSRDQIVRLPRGQGNYNIPYSAVIIFFVQLTTSRIGNLTPLIHTLLYVITTHTYFEHSSCKY